MYIGSSSIWVELAPDQMNGETHSCEGGFPLEETLTSFSREISCHPSSFPEGTEAVVLLLEVESDVSIRIDATSFEEL